MGLRVELNDDGTVKSATPIDEPPAVPAGEREAAVARRGEVLPEHDCWENAVPYKSDGALGHGWECGLCGAFLQAG